MTQNLTAFILGFLFMLFLPYSLLFKNNRRRRRQPPLRRVHIFRNTLYNTAERHRNFIQYFRSHSVSELQIKRFELIQVTFSSFLPN